MGDEGGVQFGVKGGKPFRGEATLGVPENLRLMIVLPVGKAKEPPAQAPKRPLEEMVYWERWGEGG